MRALAEPEGVTARAFMNPPSMALGPNTPAWRRAEIPGANGHGTARALARSTARSRAAADGVGALARRRSRAAARSSRAAPTSCSACPTRFGLGFMLRAGIARGGRCLGAGAFGHPGAGGSLGFADPEARLGFGYVMNRMGPHILLDDRAIALVDAMNGCLGRKT